MLTTPADRSGSAILYDVFRSSSGPRCWCRVS